MKGKGMLADAVQQVDTWARVTFILGGGATALWLTIRLVVKLQGVIEERFNTLIERSRKDSSALAAELEKERETTATLRSDIVKLRNQADEDRAKCDRDIAALRREIAVLRSEIN